MADVRVRFPPRALVLSNAECGSRNSKRRAPRHSCGAGETPAPLSRRDACTTKILSQSPRRRRMVRFRAAKCETVERHGTPTGSAAKLKPWCVWVRIPPVLLRHQPVTPSDARWTARPPVKRPPVTGNVGSIPTRGTESDAERGVESRVRWRFILRPVLRTGKRLVRLTV